MVGVHAGCEVWGWRKDNKYGNWLIIVGGQIQAKILDFSLGSHDYASTTALWIPTYLEVFFTNVQSLAFQQTNNKQISGRVNHDRRTSRSQKRVPDLGTQTAYDHTFLAYDRPNGLISNTRGTWLGAIALLLMVITPLLLSAQIRRKWGHHGQVDVAQGFVGPKIYASFLNKSTTHQPKHTLAFYK